MPHTARAPLRGRGQGRHRGGRPAANIDSSQVRPKGMDIMDENEHTLKYEALNTQRRQASWSSDQRLRHSRVNFVSAGASQPLEPKDPEISLADMTLDEVEYGLDGYGKESRVDIPRRQDALSISQGEMCTPVQDETTEPFLIDTQGGGPQATGLPTPLIRSKSPSLYDSSDEVILFRGRDRTGKGLSMHPLRKKKDESCSQFHFEAVEDKMQDHQGPHITALMNMEQCLSGLAESVELDSRIRHSGAPTRLASELLETSENKHKSGSDTRSPCSRQIKQDHEQALLADYINNMEDQDLNSIDSHHLHDLGDTESDKWQAADVLGDPPSEQPLKTGWERSELCDLDDLSTSDEVLGTAESILSKRERSKGFQYLVVWEERNVDEAQWVPVSRLTDANAVDLIGRFEAEERLLVEAFGDGESDSEINSDEDIKIGGAYNSAEDDLDLVQRRIDRMTDEKIARLLAKQEDLGMGSSELILYDDSAEAEIENDSMTALRAPKASGRRLVKKNINKRPKGDFPSATILADAYDGFDVMDFERPSLKRKSKGRRGKSAFDLSDSEIEGYMQMAWEKDRLKKKERKMERQELRAEGFLGSNRKKPDLRARYTEGMGIHAVKDEIKNFLIGNNTTLSLPPMGKADRKVVHELAHAFNLKSKSAGNGIKRFPILYRNSRTSRYVESKFTAIEARLTRHYLPRMDFHTSAPPKRTSNGGFASAAVSYRDGDIVGGSAPEIGTENRGRAMLEKMGWSTGTALGALNNKGILEPVSHVVKMTKAGLG